MFFLASKNLLVLYQWAAYLRTSNKKMADVPIDANKGCVGVQSDNAGKASGCEGCPNPNICASGEAKQADPAIAQIPPSSPAQAMC